MSPFAASYDPQHDITKDLREPTLFHEVRSVGGQEGFSEIALTGDASWAERDLARLDGEGEVSLDPDDRRGPVAVGVAGRPRVAPGDDAEAGDSAEEAREPRLVVFGDSDFASNEYVDAYSNRDLFVNAVNWLMGDIEAIAVRPNQSRASRFELTAAQFRSIRTLSLFVLPQVIAVLGVFTWWSRRNTAG
jgi:hypothetical protein